MEIQVTDSISLETDLRCYVVKTKTISVDEEHNIKENFHYNYYGTLPQALNSILEKTIKSSQLFDVEDLRELILESEKKIIDCIRSQEFKGFAEFQLTKPDVPKTPKPRLEIVKSKPYEKPKDFNQPKRRGRPPGSKNKKPSLVNRFRGK